MIDTYRRLKLMRSHFEMLIQTVTGIGNTDKAVRDLETKIDQEQARVSSYNFDHVTTVLGPGASVQRFFEDAKRSFVHVFNFTYTNNA